MSGLYSVASGVRALWRDARSGELQWLALALFIAVTAVASVGFLTDRVGRALERDSAQMLGGDMAVDSPDPPSAAFVDHARQLGLASARTVQFPSMAGFGDEAQLVSLKAVSQGYPLRGVLSVSRSPEDAGEPAAGIPEAGTVWVDAQVLAMLGAEPGDLIQVGELALKADRIITFEPDRGVQFVNVAPRAMINMQDLPGTGLLGPGSRVRHALLLAGPERAVKAYESWLAPRLGRGSQLRTLDSARPEITGSLDRARQFLVLVALLAVLMAAVAVALATRRFVLRHRDGVAIMRCLGATRRQLAIMLWVEFLLLALVSSAAGVATAWGVQHGLAIMVAAWFDAVLPAASWQPAWQGLATGVVLVLGFSLPALMALRGVPPSHVLRRQLASTRRYRWPAYTLAGLVFYGLSWWISGQARMSLVMVGGFVAALGIFALLAWLLVRLLALMRPRLEGSPALRFALAGLVRRKALTLTQISALSVGLMALLLLAIVRTDLLAGWRDTLPVDAPNTFLINIQPGQRDLVRQRLQEAGLGEHALAPMVRARLVAVNGRAVDGSSYDDERASRMVEREFNLSYLDRLPASNTLSAGRWLDPQKNEVSLEAGLARTLRIDLGDTLEFDVAGQPVRVAVSSLREVRWDSFDVNFFAVLSPAALRDAPATFITSLHLPADRAAVKQRLVREFPNLTVFDVGAILAQAQAILERAASAVQLLFSFTVLAGLLVLGAAFSATRDERTHEAAILRVLGAGSALLSGALRIEMLLVGALAGLLAAAGAISVASVLAARIFEFALPLPWWPWPVGAVAGAVAAWAGGSVALRGVLSTPPLASLREVI